MTTRFGNPDTEEDIIVYQQFVLKFDIIGINPGGYFRNYSNKKKDKLKIADAIIAATALKNDLALVADNDKDFMRIPLLK